MTSAYFGLFTSAPAIVDGLVETENKDGGDGIFLFETFENVHLSKLKGHCQTSLWSGLCVNNHATLWSGLLSNFEARKWVKSTDLLRLVCRCQQ